MVEKEDTASRLDESQFGYQSYHYVNKLPKGWLSIPTLKDFAEYKAEIQVRTMAQHIWAAASHNLQYKQEDNVPKTVKRSINRVSALLETVDLEFERVLREREHYIEELVPTIQDEQLNVDLLKEILDSHLPIANRVDNEEYSELIQNLSNCGIEKSSQVINLINEQLEEVLERDKKIVKHHIEEYKKSGVVFDEDHARAIKKGAYFTHSGLVRVMLVNKFGRDMWLKSFQLG